MAVMKKDVNIGLLILIIASIILFSGFSVYYQTTFKDVSLEYKEKLEQLSDVTKELGTKRQELNETYSLRVKAETDREALDAKYKDASDENERLDTDNVNLRSEISSTKNDLAEKTAELGATKTSLIAANAQINVKDDRIDSLKDEIDCLEAEVAKADADEDISSC